MKYQSSEKLFQLIKTLSRGEKRHFYLFASRNADNGRVIRLYKILDTMTTYDEGKIIRSMSSTRQIPNLKTNLYHLLLDSLRVQKSLQPERELHKRMEHAGILFDRGLYAQSLKLLFKLKPVARLYNQVACEFQIVNLQKKIIPFTNNFSKYMAVLDEEANRISEQLVAIGKLSTFSMLLYHHHQHYGEIVNESHLQEIEKICQDYFTQPSGGNFYAKLNLFQGLSWGCLLKKDFAGYYENVKKWNALFNVFPQMKEIEKLQHLKALYYWQDACYLTVRSKEQGRVVEALDQFFLQNEYANFNETSLYIAIAKLNQLLLEKRYEELTEERKTMEATINLLKIKQPAHTLVELWYKMAQLCFYADDYENAIKYSNHIINSKKEIRFDLQLSARFIHLAGHYYLGNFDILESLAHSTRRFIEGTRKLNAKEAKMIAVTKELGMKIDKNSFFYL